MLQADGEIVQGRPCGRPRGRLSICILREVKGKEQILPLPFHAQHYRVSGLQLACSSDKLGCVVDGNLVDLSNDITRKQSAFIRRAAGLHFRYQSADVGREVQLAGGLGRDVFNRDSQPSTDCSGMAFYHRTSHMTG